MALETIIKRDGTVAEFKVEKLVEAIRKSGEETGEFDEIMANKLATEVVQKVEGVEDVTVEAVQDAVEGVLLDSEYKATAKAYIIYREFRKRSRRPNIFERRIQLKPYEYPHHIEYQKAIQHSYWLHTQYNYTSDVQDFKVGVSESERNAIKNAMLAISQVEVAVKNFWGDLHNRLPKPEISAVGATFSANEVIHHDAYSHLLEILGLNDEFTKIGEIPALANRVKYLTDAAQLSKSESNRDFTKSLILFSLFIEHVSLFSQFLILMSFNKHRNIFKGISNVIEATSKEEQIHGLYGIELVNTIREENPEWFDETMEKDIVEACERAYEAEMGVIDWIFEAGELEFMSKDLVKEFIKNRFNNSLISVGYSPLFEVDDDLLVETDWFDDEIIASKLTDFFNKHNVEYAKKTQSVTSADLF